jgi:hypothetical protein
MIGFTLLTALLATATLSFLRQPREGREQQQFSQEEVIQGGEVMEEQIMKEEERKEDADRALTGNTRKRMPTSASQYRSVL